MASSAPPMSPEGRVGGVGVAEAPRPLGSPPREESPILDAARKVADDASRTAAASDKGGENALRNILDFTPEQMARVNAAMEQLHPTPVAQSSEASTSVGRLPSGEQNPQDQATDAQVEAALDAAARQQVADIRQRIDEFKSWTPDQVSEEIAVYERRLNMANGMMQKGSPPETQRLGQEQFRKAQDRLDELRSAQRDAHARERPTGGEADVDRARREVQARLDFNQKLSEMTVGQLNTQSQLEQGNLTDLESMLNGPLTRAERDAINEKIRDTKARIDTVDKYKSLKEPAEKEQQTKSEAEAQKAEEAKEHEELIKTRAETASTEDIKDFEENISSINGEISDFEKQFAELDRQIAAEADKDAKAELTQRRKELRKNIIDARTRLKTYESALETATAKKTKAEDEYGKLDTDEKVAELLRLAGKGSPLTEAQYKDLCRNIATGEFTAEQLGRLVDHMGRGLANGKADREMVANLTALSARSSEFGLAVIQKIKDTKEGAAKIKEMFPDPSAWEKILKLAGKNKGLLALLLAILGVALTAVTAGVAPAIAAVGAGGAGLGAVSGTRK